MAKEATVIDKENIEAVVEDLVDFIGKEQITFYKALTKGKIYKDINKAEEFYLRLVQPYKEFLSGLIASEISKKYDVTFILLNYDFLGRHFEGLLSRFEGTACCFDKALTIMQALFDFYKKGERISFNYAQEYTLQLPKIIFKTHESIVDFYESLKSLYYGNSEEYFLQLSKIQQSVSAYLQEMATREKTSHFLNNI